MLVVIHFGNKRVKTDISLSGNLSSISGILIFCSLNLSDCQQGNGLEEGNLGELSPLAAN